jgi:hypothetical protein
LKIVREVLICGLLTVLIAVGVRSLILIDHLDATVTSLPKLVDARLAAVEKDAFYRIDTAEDGVLNEVANARKDLSSQLNYQVTGLREDLTGPVLHTLDARLASIQSDANRQLTVTNKTLADTAIPLASAAKQVNAALPDFLDCQLTDYGVGNKNCLYIRYGDLSSSLDRTLSAVAKAAPDMVANADKIATSSAGVAASADATGKEVTKAAQNFNKPQTFWQAFRTWTLTIARIVSYF